MPTGFKDLVLAVQDDRQALARVLVGDLGVNARDEAGRTPLMVAEYFRRDSLVAYLLESGADATAKDSEGRNASDYRIAGQTDQTAEGLHGLMVKALLDQVKEQRISEMKRGEIYENERRNDSKNGL